MALEIHQSFVVVVCKSNPHPVRHIQDWGRGFIILLPQAAVSSDQMLGVMVLSQYQVLSSKTVRPSAYKCTSRTKFGEQSSFTKIL